MTRERSDAPDEDRGQASRTDSARAPQRRAGLPPPRPIYTPETPDALRDGLYAGFHAHHRKPTPKGRPE